MNDRFSKAKVYASLISLGCCGGAIFVLPYLRYVFYDLQIGVSGMNNAQSAFLMTIYTLVSTVLAVPCGMLIDRIPSKTSVIIALLGTVGIAVFYAFTFTSYNISLAVWSLLAITTSGLYWPVFSKILNIIGSKCFKGGRSGLVFGIYYACNGSTSALVNAIALFITTMSANPAVSYRNVVLVSAAFTFAATIGVFLFLDSELIKPEEYATSSSSSVPQETIKGFEGLKLIVRNPLIWCIIIVVDSAYTLNAFSTFFNPFLTSVIGVSTESSGVFAILRNHVFLILSIFGGFIADRVFRSTSKWLATAYLLGAIVIAGFFFIPSGINPLMVSLYTLIPAAILQLSQPVSFSAIGEIGIPQNLMGTATGFISAFGVVDLIFTPVAGIVIDIYGNAGYYYLFAFLIGVLALGSVAAFIIYRRHHHIAS